MEKRTQYRWHGITAIAVCFLLFMHLYKLTQVPYGLNVDEASGAYDALNIARYGVDRHLNSYPVYFTNYADGQNALYIYATAFLIRFFGLSKGVIRTVPTMAALVAAVFGWLYMKNHMPSRKGRVIWLILYAILPVFTMTQRFGLESHLLLPMPMISVYFVAKAMDSDKWRYYLIAGVCLGITLYTYALTYIVIPVFGLLLIGYALLIRRLRPKKVCALIGFGRCVYEALVSVKEKTFSYVVPMLLWFVADWTMGAFLSGHSVPNSTRMIGVFMTMLFFLVKGLYCVVDAIESVSVKRILTSVMSLYYLVSFLGFSTYYFTDFNEDAFPMKWLFYETYDGIEAFLKENEDQSWQERPVSYPWNYIYYALEFEINPYELNLPVNGREKFGKDYINEYPEEILLESNYVVYKTDSTSKEYLGLLGYEEITINDAFAFYVSPLDSYQVSDGQGGAVTIEKWKVSEEGI